MPENLIEILKIIILSVVQGISEWLPISSTGHLIILNELIVMQSTAAFKELFFVLVQLGSVLAVVVLFWQKLFPFGFKNGFTVKKDILILWYKILIASIPAGAIGVLFNDKIDEIFYNATVVAAALIIYGALFIIIERRKKKPPQDAISYKTAFMLGVFQMLALIPGTSRSGATIIGGILLGLSRTAAASFSFFLAIPAMFGASAVKLLGFGFSFTPLELTALLTGMLTAFAVSMLTIRFLLNFVKTHSFELFGWYRIILGAVVILFFVFS